MAGWTGRAGSVVLPVLPSHVIINRMDFPERLQDRSLRLAAALAIAVAIPVAVLFYFQFRSLGDLEKTSTVVLQQLSHETADAFTTGIDEELKAPYIRALVRIQQGRTEPLDLPW